MPEARAPGGGLGGKLKRLWNKWLTPKETEEKKTSPPSADNNRKRGMNRGRSNCRAEGSEHAPERKHKSPEDAPTRRRQRGGGRNAGDRAEKPAATNRRPRIRPSSTLKQKPPEESSAASVSPVAQTPSTPPVADTPPLVETVESPTKIPAASVSPVAQTPPKPPVLIRHRWWRRLSRRRKFPPLPCRLLHKRLPNRLLLIRHRRLLLCRWLKAQRNLTCPKRSIRRLCWMGHLP